MQVASDDFTGPQLSPQWRPYNGPYNSGAHNCASPSHVAVSSGLLHLVMSHEDTGTCGAGWYTGGLELIGSSAIDQQVTVRFRVVSNGVSSHWIVPMRWPDDDASWPAGGEEDYCEGEDLTGCSSHLHYGASNDHVTHDYVFDPSQWHTLQTTRLGHVVRVAIDGTVAWTYTGSSTTLPDTLKHVVLQQECPLAGCPTGSTGSEEIQVDWITVENRATDQSPPIDHVFVVVEENRSFDQIIGSADAPYLNELASQGLLATDYHGVTHPSLPNYLAMIGGDTFGITTDCSPSDPGCSIGAANLADAIDASGRSWRAYLDAMPTPCRLTSSGTYRVSHNPFVYFTDIGANPARCSAGVRPVSDLTGDLAAEATTPSLAFVVPDNCHDMHDCSVATGDGWLRSLIPAILDSPAWASGRSLLVITFDEDDGLSGNRIPSIVLGPAVVPHSRMAETADHYRLLRSIEEMWSLPPLTSNDGAAIGLPIFRAEPNADASPPSAPAGLTGFGASPTEIRLTWSASADEVGVASYQVFRDGAWLAAPVGTSFSDVSVQGGVTYTYRVRALDADGNLSGYSGPATVTAPPPEQSGPGISRGAISTTVNGLATASISIAAPAGVASGDLLVACIATNGGGISSGGVPAGWSPIATVTGLSNPKLFGYLHVASASEPAAYTWTLSGSVVNAGGIAQYLGVDPATPLDAPVSTVTAPLTTAFSVPGMTTVTANTMLVGCVAANSSSTSLLITSPAGMSEAWDIPGKRQELADGLQPNIGPTGPRTWTISSARDAAGWLAALRAR